MQDEGTYTVSMIRTVIYTNLETAFSPEILDQAINNVL